MDYLLCITRSTTGLEAKISRCQSEFRPPISDKPYWQNLYKTVLMPFKDIKASAVTRRLEAAWQRLEFVEKWDAATLTDVLVVLTESVAIDNAASRANPILRAEPEPNQAIALQTLWQYREQAIKPLCDLGYETAQVNALMALSIPPAEPNLCLQHSDISPQAKSHRFPSTFREEIWPLLRGLPWYRVEATLALFWHLKLHEDCELRTTVSRFLAQSPTPFALDWLQQIAEQASSHPTHFCA